MKYKLKAFSIFEVGKRTDSKGNPHQEDCIYPAENNLSDTDRTFILCDGMGGHDAGEVASAAVCEAMSQSVIGANAQSNGTFTDAQLLDAVDAAFKALDQKDTGASKKMGTTMTFLKLHSDGATIAHMGDSRVYHIRPGENGSETQILFQTEDHSLINDLIKVGELTLEEARHSKQKNIITRALQPRLTSRPKPSIHHISDIRPGDYFYMCSDGMLEQPDMEEGDSLRNIFSHMGGDDNRKIEILKSVTEDNSDNHSALIIHILDVDCQLFEQLKKLEPAAMPEYNRTLDISDSSKRHAPNKKRTKASHRGMWLIILLCCLIASVLVLLYVVFQISGSAKAIPLPFK